MRLYSAVPEGGLSLSRARARTIAAYSRSPLRSQSARRWTQVLPGTVVSESHAEHLPSCTGDQRACAAPVAVYLHRDDDVKNRTRSWWPLLRRRTGRRRATELSPDAFCPDLASPHIASYRSVAVTGPAIRCLASPLGLPYVSFLLISAEKSPLPIPYFIVLLSHACRAYSRADTFVSFVALHIFDVARRGARDKFDQSY